MLCSRTLLFLHSLLEFSRKLMPLEAIVLVFTKTDIKFVTGLPCPCVCSCFQQLLYKLLVIAIAGIMKRCPAIAVTHVDKSFTCSSVCEIYTICITTYFILSIPIYSVCFAHKHVHPLHNPIYTVSFVQ